MQLPFPLTENKLTSSGGGKDKTKRQQQGVCPLLAPQIQRKSAQWPLPGSLLWFLFSHRETLQVIFKLSSKSVFGFYDEN